MESRRPEKRRTRLWAEFLSLYLVAPLIMAVFLSPRMLFPALFFVTALGFALLAQTAGFRWQALLRGPPIRWVRVVLFALITLVLAAGIVEWARPGHAFDLVMKRPQMMLMIAVLYPFLSALPQELVFRALYFGRFQPILPDGRAGLFLNAAVFSFAHLMYWNAVVLLLTFGGGIVFAWAYVRRGSFPLAFVLHAVAGCAIFAAGLGIYFYSGNVHRPF